MAIVRTTTKDNSGNTAVPTTGKGPRPSGALARPGVRPGGRPAVAAPKGNSKQFILDTIVELRRVKWPTRDQVSAGTIVTVLLLVFFALYICGLDFASERFFMTLGLYPGAVPH